MAAQDARHPVEGGKCGLWIAHDISAAGGSFHLFYAYSEQSDPTDWHFDRHLIGFQLQFDYNRKTGLEFLRVDVPLWLPTTISVALLWLVWRWTRPKAKVRAFPVEVEKTSGESNEYLPT